MKFALRFLAISFLCVLISCSEKIPDHKNPKLPVEQRVKDLLSRMTPEEKFWQLFMIPGDLGADSSKYDHGIFGFQVSATSKGSGAAQQLLSYHSEESALQLARKI